jgi:endoribonuclease LACTB2
MRTGFFGGDGQPAAVSKIRPAAGVIPVQMRDGEWWVYLVRRGTRGRFFPGFHAFPGGALERADEGSLHSCAARELWEETGLWAGREVPPAERRRNWLNGSEEWSALAAEFGLDSAQFLPAGVRTTPAYALLRFRAHFFLWICPPEQQALVWPGELEDGAWWHVGQALEAWRSSEIFCAAPTSDSLQRLAGSTSLEEASASLNTAPEDTPDPIPVYPGLCYLPLQTPTLPPAEHTLCMILGEGRVLLVDPGAADPAELARISAVLTKRNWTVEAALFTHHHHDHVGGLSWCRAQGWPVWGHPITAALLGESWDRNLRDGEALGEWCVLHTPGHASGHLALWHEQRRVLLSGDLVSGLSTILIAPPDGHMGEYLHSLQRCSDLQPRLVLPSHGGPYGPETRLLENTLAHRLEREGKVLRALRAGGGDLEELLQRAYADVTGPALDLARISLRAHLAKLVEDGSARYLQERWLPA